MAKRIGQPFRQPGVLCLAVLAALAGGGGVAYAAYCGLEDDGSSSYHAPAPTVSPKSVRAGEAVTVTASGLDAGSEYYVHINSYSADYYLGHDYTQTADAAGALPPQKWWVPPTAIAGLYALYVVHAVSGSISHSTTIEVSAPEPKPESSCTYIGGLYKNVPPATGCERHHIPSQASFRGIGAYTKECTPVIRMDKWDHRRTSSHGGVVGSITYRGQERQLVLEGNFTGAFDKNVNEDLRPKFGSKYDVAIALARIAMSSLPAGGTSTC